MQTALSKKILITMEVPPDKTNYWNYTEQELDNFLVKFWFATRKDLCEDSEEPENNDPEMKEHLYKANSVCNYLLWTEQNT